MKQMLNSVRAAIAFILVLTVCMAAFVNRVTPEKMALLKELALMALTFYFVLKKRKDETN